MQPIPHPLRAEYRKQIISEFPIPNPSSFFAKIKAMQRQKFNFEK
jgi:hypothetical protein